MSCQNVQKLICAYLDCRLASEERDGVSQHLAICRECNAHLEQVSEMRNLLRDLPAVAPPVKLTSQLRVLASHERARHLARINLSTMLQGWRDRARLMVDNLMRPLALPFAGGVISALFLFSVLVPTLGFQHNVGNDVPIAFLTKASIEEINPFTINNDETVVELVIDEKGQITDYSIPLGKASPELKADIGNMVLFSRFTPATLFGQPTSGKVLVSFRRSHIVVKG